MKKKTVVIINDRSSVKGGADAVALNQLDELRSYGHKVILFSTNSIALHTEKTNNRDVLREYGLSFKNSAKNLFWLKAYRELRKIIKQYDPDIFIIHGWTKQLSSSIFYALIGKKSFWSHMIIFLFALMVDCLIIRKRVNVI